MDEQWNELMWAATELVRDAIDQRTLTDEWLTRYTHNGASNIRKELYCFEQKQAGARWKATKGNRTQSYEIVL